MQNPNQKTTAENLNEKSQRNASASKNNLEKPLYRVFDEMGFEDLLVTDDLALARNTAQNHEAVLINNHTNEVIKDYCY